jgi:AcrR family transcriptional regulator
MSTTKEETRSHLLKAARKLLVERGFHGVGLEDIAAAAGVSRQAVYKSHFTSKADLLLALVQHMQVAEKLDELTRPVLEARSALAMFEETILAIVKIEGRVHDIAMVLSAAAVSDAGAAAAWRDRMEVKRGAMRAAVRRLADEGRLSAAWEIEDAVDVLSVLTSVEAYHRLVVERGWTPESLVRKIRELSEGSILTAPRRRTSKKEKGRR